MRIKTANGKTTVVITREEFLRLGEQHGWLKTAKKPTKEQLQQHQMNDHRNIRPVPAAGVRQVGLGMPAQNPAVPRPMPVVPQVATPMTGPQGAAASAAKQKTDTTNPLGTAPDLSQQATPGADKSLGVNQVINMFQACKNINFDQIKQNPDPKDAQTIVSVAQEMLNWANKAVQILGNG